MFTRKFLTPHMLGNLHFFVCCHIVFLFLFFLKLLVTASKKSFRNTFRMSNSLDPDLALCYVGPDQDLVSTRQRSHFWQVLTLKAPITTAADDKFGDIFPIFRKKNKV